MPRFIVLLLVLVVAACGPTMVQTDVTRFHQLPIADGTRSFTILPDDGQRGSLEFQRYAELTANQLAAYGWHPVPSSAQADAVAFLHWGIGPSRTEVWSSPSTVYGGYGYGWHHPYWYGGGAMPFGDPFPYWETQSATYYPKWVSVEILDAAAWKAGQRLVLFEGRAVTESGGREITPLVPYLMRALFTGFPGASGRTVHVNVPLEKG
ncbi:MAG: DUF4136 domain-containing protein [Solirubrobacterales bacterium]